MTDVLEVPTPLPLARMAQVELMQTGTWDASTGQHTFTTDDLANAVAALECPAVRRPIIKLGHTDPRFDGEPAVGWLANMATADDGHTLVADLVGMPGWLGPILASAFPDRSIEGQWHYKCALGHEHGFVLTGLALLGVTHPAIGTLASLQDVATLYGVSPTVAASAASEPFTVHLKGSDMTTTPRVVAASVTTEDVRRAYYDEAPWSVWIEEFSLDPLQLIVIDDDTGERMRVPVVVSPDGDGTEGVTFGQAVPVVVRYEDATPATAPDPNADPAEVAASASPNVIRYANRAESRPGRSAAASTPAAAADGATTEGGSVVEITNEQLAALRTALGLADDADIDTIIATVQTLVAIRTALSLEDTATVEDIVAAVQALIDAGAAGTTAAAARRLPDGVTTIDSEVLATLQANAALGRAAAERQEREDRERVVDAALSKGKITPARRGHYLKLMAADPKGTAELLDGLPDEIAVPISEIGHAAASESSSEELDWFSAAPSAPSKKGA